MRTTPRRSRFGYLLAAEVALIVLYPFFDTGRNPGLFGILALPTVVAGVYAAAGNRRDAGIALVLGLLAVTGNLAAAFGGFHAHGLVSWMVFSVFVLVVVLRRVLQSADVTIDTLLGAVAAYLLIGVVWGMAYAFLDIVAPGSFQSLVAHQHFTWGDFTFLSFVTLTSVGYGDLVPLSGHAKALAIIESVTGVMYPAILIARLIGLHASARRHD
jgi:hypothetical protein